MEGFIEFEAFCNSRLDDTLRPQIEQLLAPAADTVNLAPQEPQVHAKHALVGVDERQGVELKPGRARKQYNHVADAPLFLGNCRGNAEHTEPPGRREQAISFSERIATDGIEDEFDATAVRDFPRPGFEILSAVVDQKINAESL